MHDDPSRLGPSLDEQLVAYLDGELDAEGRRSIEELIATDADVRARLHAMEQTWAMLDELDSTPASEQTIHSTLEMVAVAAEQEVEQALADAPARHRRMRWTIGGGLLAAFVVGFVAVACFWPNPNRELLEDLPIIERLDDYRQAGDIAMLRSLYAAGLFADNDKGTAAQPTRDATDESIDQRRLAVMAMTQSQREELLQDQERFKRLEPKEQARLRELQRDLEPPDAVPLRSVMRNCSEWLRNLQLASQLEFKAIASPEQRVAWIRERQARERARDDIRRLGDRDAQAVLRWFGRWQSAFEQTAFTAEERKRLEAVGSTPGRTREVLRRMLDQWKKDGTERPPFQMNDDDLKRLHNMLTPPCQQLLDVRPTTAEKWRLAAIWTESAFRPPPGGRYFRGPRRIGDDVLLDFFENTLNKDERDGLMSMPSDEMQQALLRLYLRHTAGNRPPHGG